MDELVELDGYEEPETESDAAPEETKTSFWGGVAEFLTMLAFGATG